MQYTEDQNPLHPKTMAKVIYNFLADARGKLNGIVMSRNRAGNYLRNKTTPLNPQTPAQSGVRGAFGALTQRWRTLTQEQRNTWINGASEYPQPDGNGGTYIPSPFNLFMKANQNIQNVGGSIITDLQTPLPVPVVENLTVLADVTTQTLSVTWDTPLGVGVPLQIEVVANYSPGKSIGSVKNQFRVLGVAAGSATVATKDFTTELTDKYGPIVDGQKFAVRATPIVASTGQAGVPTTAEVVAAI